MLDLAPVKVEAERRGEVLYLRSGHALATPPPRLTVPLLEGAARHPERLFLAERAADGSLREVTYADAVEAARGIATHLLDVAPRPVLILSGNGIDHALMTLGGYLAGVPVAPLSAAYSLMSRDHGKLRHIARKLQPGLVYAAERAPFADAIAAVCDALERPVPVVTSDCDTLASWMRDADLDRLAEVEVGPDTVAKVLFTSGSTGFPKGVPNTHGMLAANQQMISQLWPSLDDEPPVLVDWLPWSHTFGGNHNFHLAMFHGGTLLIDDGKPSPALVERTIANLREMPPTLYFNVPAGFAALVPHLERDGGLRKRFFERLRLVFYAGAALPDDLWQRLVALAKDSCDTPPFMTTAWGSTETSPLSTSAHFPLSRAGNIGVPAPGVSLKLVPNGGKLEVRVAGPHVMKSYLDEPGLTALAFDDEGFYRIGDALKLADPDDPAAGLLFDGRVAEDFKLATGTWVNVGKLRTAVLTACSPAVQDLVVAGHDREAIGLLAWPNLAGARNLCGDDRLDLSALCAHETLRDHVRRAVEKWNEANPRSSMRVDRLLLLDRPPSIDAGEITDKGYINQRATLEGRQDDVSRLFGDDDSVLRFDRRP